MCLLCQSCFDDIWNKGNKVWRGDDIEYCLELEKEEPQENANNPTWKYYEEGAGSSLYCFAIVLTKLYYYTISLSPFYFSIIFFHFFIRLHLFTIYLHYIQTFHSFHTRNSYIDLTIFEDSVT